MSRTYKLTIRNKGSLPTKLKVTCKMVIHKVIWLSLDILIKHQTRFYLSSTDDNKCYVFQEELQGRLTIGKRKRNLHIKLNNSYCLVLTEKNKYYCILQKNS